MLRALVLIGAAAALLLLSLNLTWGTKEVSYTECKIDDSLRARCVETVVIAHYDPRALRGTLEIFEGRPEALEYADTHPFWHPYDEGAIGEPAWWASPMLAKAPKLLGLAALALPLAAVAGFKRQGHPIHELLIRWSPLIALGLLLVSLLASLGGMVWHSSQWTANQVNSLNPTIGTGVLLLAGVTGTTGILRLQQIHTATPGHSGQSPLIPAGTLFGFDPEPAPSDSNAPGISPTKFSLPRFKSWPKGGVLAILALAVLSASFMMPLIHKDINLKSCSETPDRGWVCQERFIAAEYHTTHLKTTTLAGTERTESYFGEFQETYGGPSGIGLGASLLILGTLLVFAWTAWRLFTSRSPPTLLTLLAGSVVVLGFSAVMGPILFHAATWRGAPAYASRPGLGLWFGAVAIGMALRSMVISHRDGRADSNDATARASKQVH